ncbi:aspartyl-phosphate phosphatase Spo0E family protein [Neobacillus terrae]|uniref:aspartyl-phosphate phosphatase Spo0E family protein n=1 Tax=Neobacillus terrae TaxID=3034837 RepID=UPI00140C5ACA|nr:aspartyl-phosphate phosphatase Spo0E family protein [Neobacillus terrae]NHM30894.1 aspartyl-phosphate phosphatase Spo0E family protein [Neobacillus terrae]
MKNQDTLKIEASEELCKHIEFLRKELIRIGLELGLNSSEAISISQELDKYLAVCQKCCPQECHQKTINIG